jgi:hypothetical protein
MLAIRPSGLLLASLVWGCTSKPPDTATGEVTIDGANVPVILSGSYDEVAYPKQLEVGLYPTSGPSIWYQFEFDWADSSGTTTIDLSDPAVWTVLVVESDAESYSVCAGPCTSSATSDHSALDGTAGGSMTLATSDDAVGDRYTGTFDLTLAWQDAKGTNHSAAASITFATEIQQTPPAPGAAE